MKNLFFGGRDGGGGGGSHAFFLYSANERQRCGDIAVVSFVFGGVLYACFVSFYVSRTMPYSIYITYIF
jgi:hypothetical protein